MFMRKLVLVAGLSMLALLPAKAEEGNTVIWGVKAAFDVNIPGKWHADFGTMDWYKPGCGFTVGGVCNIDLTNGFYLEPGVSLFYDTYVAKLSVSDDMGHPASADPRVSKFGVRVPVIVGYWIPVGDTFDLAVFTGPEVSYGFSGKVKLKKEFELEDWDDALYGKNDGAQRRCDLAWKVGVGFPIRSFVVSVEGAIGITDLIKGPASCRDNRVSVSATYYF